jgi:hypothetical protein
VTEDKAVSGEFEIISVNSGLVLDVPAFSTEPGVLIQQWTENGGANQQWTIHRPAGFPTGYEIVSVNSGLVLDVPAFSTEPGVLIQQWTENGGANQQWNIKGKDSTTYEIVSVNSGLVLDVPAFSTQPGAQIQQWTENGGSNQQWTFKSLNGAFISVVGQRNQTGGDITIVGRGFSPGISLYVNYMGVPARQGIWSNGLIVGVGSDGTFSITDAVSFTSINPNDAFGYVAVVMETEEGNVLAIGSVLAVYWVS